MATRTKSSSRKSSGNARKRTTAAKAATKSTARKSSGRQSSSANGNGSAPEAKPLKVTKAQVKEYLQANAATDRDCPERGVPFVQESRGGTRVFLRLEGLAKHLGEQPVRVRKAIEGLGFARAPFSYQHSKKGQTSASYYSAPANGMATGVEHRTARVRAEGKDS